MSAGNRTNLKNRLLAALSPADFEQLAPHLHPVPLSLRQVLYEPGLEIEKLYFVEEGLCSILTVMADGSTVEVGMIGNDGMVGFSAILITGQASPSEVIVQVPGSARCINTAQFRTAFNQSEGIRRVVHRCIADSLMLGAQTAACNRLHSMEQRLARWLLMASDRIASDTMPMTHEFLAQMLGVRRSGVTLVCGELQRSGLIGYHHGTMTILNREGVQALACECYRLDHERLNQPI
jgi:CRP-like cAMP-binding protein